MNQKHSIVAASRGRVRRLLVVTGSVRGGAWALLLAACAPLTPELPPPAYEHIQSRIMDRNSERPDAGWFGLLGYKTLRIDPYRFQHDTHPDDHFLANSSVPGSAGTTELSRLNYLALGFGYGPRIEDSWSFPVAGGLLLGLNSTEHQNDNDTRPPASGAFVYSNSIFGAFGTAGVHYHVDPLFGGLEMQLAGVLIESGWDRFNQQQRQSASFQLVPSIGPVLGCYLGESCTLEATMQFGEADYFGLQFRIHH